ncbi:hypothetical protein [Dyadobacter sp. CY323]|uniref:hypothetical protein n=1 Tax=Dyadobacter sp. CY323 TaxID=2907302 RepID=UPI001F22520B|nr:hypothetical protein [Dyadobacter sp. CY323]MCE6987473.1 hypothetical protein [Dyadobacter sp. CY323]
MRSLGLFERTICNKLLTSDNKNLIVGELLDFSDIPLGMECDFHTNSALLFNLDNNNTSFENFGYGHDQVTMYVRKVITVISLISLLEKEGYIITFSFGHFSPKKICTRLYQKVSEKPKFKYAFPDPTIEKLILQNFQKQIIITQEFRDFITSSFVTRDENRFRETRQISIWALIIAILTAVISIFSK